MTARLAAALIALVAAAGLVVQFRATYAATHSVPETLWIILRYFTILANLLVFVAMAAIALGARVRPPAIGGVTLAIVLVGVVYMTLLRGLIELSGGALLADTLLHKATPILVPAWWLAFAPKGRLGWCDPLMWVSFPLAYLPYALWRGATDGKYPYPFLNIDELGASSVALNAVLIAAGFLIAGYALVALDRWLGQGSAGR